MTRRKYGLNQPKSYKDGAIYWQSAAYNSALFSMWCNQITNLALARFKWHNLPPTCDERYLELTLLTQGVASIAHPKRGKFKDCFFSTQAVLEGAPNVYLNPPRWRSFGNNGWNYSCNWKTGVLVWENMTRYPTMQAIEVFAHELSDIMRTKQINRLHQKIPFILRGPQTKQRDMANIYKQIAGNEPAILTFDDTINTLIQADKIDTEVPFLGKELQADLVNTLTMIYQVLGIPNMPFEKTERQIESEVENLEASTEVSLLSPLNERRRACEILNRRFGDMLDAPIQVTFAKDLPSANYDFLHSLQDKAAFGSEIGDYIEATDGDNDYEV